jgi:hypothetical protein
MTDETTRATRAFETHGSFEQDGPDEFAVTTTPFDATVRTDDDRVTVRLPTLDAVVAGETVADVVERGWYETLERRLDDAHTVAETDDVSPAELTREDDAAVLTVAFESTPSPHDALAVVEYAEGTWLQGVVPGYEYREPAASLVERARQNYDDDGDGTERGGE